MRILMAVPKYPYPVVGGMERQAHELAKALVGRGHTVHALSTRFDRAHVPVTVVDGVTVHRVAWVEDRFLRFFRLFFAVARTLWVLRGHLDAVHVHSVSWFGAYVTAVAKGFGLPVIAKLPGIAGSGLPGITRRPLGSLCLALLKTSDAFITLTPDSLSELAGIRYPMSRVLRVTNGISMQQRVPSDCHAERLRVDAEPLRVVFVGRLSTVKGVRDLLRAWHLISLHATRPVVLRLVGRGSEEADLRELSVSLGISGSVEFAGHSDDVDGELHRCDLFVLPSYSEGNSNAILEAMRAGRAIVATRVGGAESQVGEEGARYLCMPGDYGTLASLMLELIEDDARRTALGHAMSARVRSVFDIESIATIYETAYRLIMSRRRDDIGGVAGAATEGGAA